MQTVRLFSGTSAPGVYNGICMESLWGLKRVAQHSLPTSVITECSSIELHPEKWESAKHSLLIFPGGKCSVWDESVSEKQRKRIIHYVEENGGRLIGICAGAYWWTEHSRYESRQKTRKFSLCSWECKGPIFPEIAVVEIIWMQTLKKVNVLVNLGGEFMPRCGKIQDSEEIEVLALYTERNTAAIIRSRRGKGEAILSGPHLELGSTDLEPLKKGFPHLAEKFQDMQKMLEATDGLRLKYLHSCFNLETAVRDAKLA